MCLGACPRCLGACQNAVTFGATVLPVHAGRFARPSTRSAYTYTPSGSSPAQLASACFGPPRCGTDRDRAGHVLAFVALLRGLGLAPAPLAASPAALPRHLRRDTASAGYRLLVSLASGGQFREPRRRVSLSSTLNPLPRSSGVIQKTFDLKPSLLQLLRFCKNVGWSKDGSASPPPFSAYSIGVH